MHQQNDSAIAELLALYGVTFRTATETAETFPDIHPPDLPVANIIYKTVQYLDINGQPASCKAALICEDEKWIVYTDNMFQLMMDAQSHAILQLHIVETFQRNQCIFVSRTPTGKTFSFRQGYTEDQEQIIPHYLTEPIFYEVTYIRQGENHQCRMAIVESVPHDRFCPTFTLLYFDHHLSTCEGMDLAT